MNNLPLVSFRVIVAFKIIIIIQTTSRFAKSTVDASRDIREQLNFSTSSITILVMLNNAKIYIPKTVWCHCVLLVCLAVTIRSCLVDWYIEIICTCLSGGYN